MTIAFSTLKSNYPTAKQPAFYQSLGGEWPTLVDKDNYKNTCAVRMSIALRKSGLPIPQEFKEAITGDGHALAIKVKTMRDVVKGFFGDGYWGVSKQPGQAVDVPNVTGIIVYHANWGHATGHFDLWTGSAFVGSGNFDDAADGYAVELWKLP